MFKTALNKKIIPHTRKLANIVPIPKPNKHTDKGTSYRPISLLPVITKTLKKSLFHLHNIQNTPMQHGYKTQDSRTTTITLDMSKAFDTINIHTLIRKLLQTNIPGTIIKFIANYIKGHTAYTTYRNHTSRQREFETGVPQGGVFSPTLLNIYTSDLPPPSAPLQVMAYTDDITITCTHTSTSAAKKYIQPYLHKVFAWTKQNNLILNPDKTTCTQFTPDPAEYTSNLDLKIHNKHFHRSQHSHYNRHKTNMRHIHTSIISMHLATRDNNQILRTPPPHINSYEEILPASLVASVSTQNKPISLHQIILTQSRRQITSITTMPPLQHPHT